MSLGFEVEINTVVRPPNEGTFGPPYKGVTLFRTNVRPGVCGVIETGTLQLAPSTVELVSEVDKNPYVVNPVWKRQIDQIADLVVALSSFEGTSAAFIRGTEALAFDRKLTTEQVEDRMGARTSSFWDLLCCCCPSEDDRVATVRNARLSPPNGRPVDAGRVQINFSTNLEHIGACLRKGHHPFEALLDDPHAEIEVALVERLGQAKTSAALFGSPDVLRDASDALIAYVFLVFHRLTFEHHQFSPGKNRFLFLPRFDLAEVRQTCLSEMDRKLLAKMDLEAAHALTADKKTIKPMDKVTFSVAAQMEHREKLERAGVQNTVQEFLRAVVLGDFGDPGQEAIGSLILRVADSTIPARVKGAANIVFEGRIPDWTRFAGKDVDLSELSLKEASQTLARGLTALGEIVVGYDVEPKARRKQSSNDLLIELDEFDHSTEQEGMLVPLLLDPSNK